MQATIDFLSPPAPANQQLRVVLVGVEFEENLSLRYLAGALQAAGYAAVEVLAYNSILEAPALAASIIASGADLVGISMAFQVRAVEDMALVQLLRREGFGGHITAGGQFATLHHPEIFEDCAGLDSIVRFEAEATVVQLATALSNSQPALHTVPGLVWRDATRTVQINHSAPEPGDINDLPWPLRKASRAAHLSLKTAHMVGSRGCHATCKYCCVAALATERSQAGRAAGNANALPGTRRRTAANVATEMAALYFEQDIRIFEFQDDNWIHPKVATAVAYFTELKTELARRGVGQIGLSLKTRADSVQPEILAVLKEIGLIRMFVGIESGTQGLLMKLGRKARDNASQRALQTLREHRVPAYFNALLFGPDIRFADIEPELEFLLECADFPFEIVEVVIYGKTGLYQSLQQEGRLHGNYLDYDYDYLEAATQRTHALVSQLDTRHFGVYSPVKMAADLGFNLGILQVFYPGPATDRLAAQVADLTRQINTDQVRVIRQAAAYGQQGTSLAQARAELQAATVATDLQFYHQIIELHHQMEQMVTLVRREEVSCYYRAGAVVQSALLAGLFLLLAGPGAAQSTAPVSSPEVKRAAARLTRRFNHQSWHLVRRELEALDQPVYSTELGRSLRGKWVNQSPVTPNDRRVSQHIQNVIDQRTSRDYHELRKILTEHNPKISIASSLTFYTDSQGIVRRVGATTAHGYKILTPALQQTIIELLQARQFHTREARPFPIKDANGFVYSSVQEQALENPSPLSTVRLQRMRRRLRFKARRLLIKLHLKRVRRGPMD